MKTYIGVKQINAEPMTRGEYNEYRGWTIPEDENPADEGYLVEYSDGYKSWSPKKQFDEAYREYHANTLVTTAKGMISDDYKERFQAEYNQLVIRYNGLRNMLAKWDKNELDFTPTCTRRVYNDQIAAMEVYINVLRKRAEVEDIDLHLDPMSYDVIPLIVKDMDDFQQLCREIVMNYTNEHMDKSDNASIDIDDTYIVWANKSLQNFKALASTNVHDGMYYELTYNGDRKELYFDAYKKFEHKKIGSCEY